MNCADCGDPAVTGERRCAECLEEVRESPNWHQGPRSTGRVKPPPDEHCKACRQPLRQERRGKWCSEACRRWARDHPGEVRVDPTCRGCGEQFRPTGSDAWCANCRSSKPLCEQCHQPMPWRLSQGGQPVRFCSRQCVGAARAAQRPPCSEPDCDQPMRTHGRCNRHYRRWYYGPDGPGDPKSRDGDPEKRKARERAKTHRRRSVGRLTDITQKYERELRAKAKRCPLCRVKLTDEPYLPNSKHLDHMIPLNPACGGTHTIGNVRIICGDCNTRRPKDGSDYIGPVTLWAQDPSIMGSRPVRGVCSCGARKAGGRCPQCQPKGLASRAADGRRAAELRAEGWRWKAIAAETGFGIGNVVTFARRWGAPEVVAKWHVEDACCRRCAAALPPQQGDKGRPRRYCIECRPPVATLRTVTQALVTQSNESSGYPAAQGHTEQVSYVR